MSIEPCVLKAEENGGNLQANAGDGCSEYVDEVHDIMAYRRFLDFSWESPSASAIFVAFHDIVTQSVSENWQKGRQNKYCLEEVVDELHVKDPALGMVLPSFGAMAAGVLGVGTTKDLTCEV